MKGQKEAVVEYIKGLGHILPSKVNLPTSEFEFIVDKVVCDIGHNLAYHMAKIRLSLKR